jgi:hypothetical protein
MSICSFAPRLVSSRAGSAGSRRGLVRLRACGGRLGVWSDGPRGYAAFVRGISKNPDDYLLGQPGYPPERRRPRAPARYTFGALVGVWALTTLVAVVVGAHWSDAVFPIGFWGGIAGQLVVDVAWRRQHQEDHRT